MLPHAKSSWKGPDHRTAGPWEGYQKHSGGSASSQEVLIFTLSGAAAGVGYKGGVRGHSFIRPTRFFLPQTSIPHSTTRVSPDNNTWSGSSRLTSIVFIQTSLRMYGQTQRSSEGHFLHVSTTRKLILQRILKLAPPRHGFFLAIIAEVLRFICE